MRAYHGYVAGPAGPVECIGVRFTKKELNDQAARKIGGLCWAVGETVDRVTAVNGTNPPQPSVSGWFVRSVIDAASQSEVGDVLERLGAYSDVEVREVNGVMPLDELDRLAGDPTVREKPGYDGRDYLGPSRFVLRYSPSQDPAA
jgi:hypothetical protein